MSKRSSRTFTAAAYEWIVSGYLQGRRNWHDRFARIGPTVLPPRKPSLSKVASSASATSATAMNHLNRAVSKCSRYRTLFTCAYASISPQSSGCEMLTPAARSPVGPSA